MGVMIELYIMIPTPNTRCVHLMASTPDEGPCESQRQKSCNPMGAHKKHNQVNDPIDQMQVLVCRSAVYKGQNMTQPGVSAPVYVLECNVPLT